MINATTRNLLIKEALNFYWYHQNERILDLWKKEQPQKLKERKEEDPRWPVFKPTMSICQDKNYQHFLNLAY